MGYLYVLMGKSATGKDSIYKELLGDDTGLKKALIYTTRPKRKEETEGVQYHFSTKEDLERFRQKGILIESRCFHTILGDWYYFTVDDGEICLGENHYILINTLEGFEKTRKYYGKDRVIPIYIEVSDEERLERALKREKGEKNPNYEELCRRFLADNRDFSEENLFRVGIQEENRFLNDDFSACVQNIKAFIRKEPYGN